ncbi:structural maintenance of chromosomes flexible hinge domain-containing protein 1 [Brachionichthys hirsutus]|uniref:structural maintenance of chromosomes flexible hinge domain-containing protein 1 n=1 Tax=Brachionichthys hirsutus TaxID=412623 RepID=UPI0036050A38
MFNSGAWRSSSSFSGEERVKKSVSVQDHRFGKKEVKDVCVEITDLDFNDFLHKVHLEFKIPARDTFVLTTTDRTVLDFDKFKVLRDGSTLYLLQKEDQALSAATKELITFTPHYDTLVRAGTYEYYMSEGRVPLPYAIAEFIDNSLTATAKNTGVREIEIQLLFDETCGKPALVVMDNGCGMTSKKLNNWAVYRRSKFLKDNSTLASEEEEGYVPPAPVPRSLNSDISYFGVGGKQAVFYIGDSARMITKPADSPDVHELVLSKEEFERKEREKENVFSGTIRNRKPGDSSHVKKSDERFLRGVIAEETRKESFTAVVVTGILPEHIAFLKKDFQVWTRQLAHVYHYYIHGVNGNDGKVTLTSTDASSKVDILITLREKVSRCPRVLNLREVDDDMQSRYIKAAADTFEFNAATEDGGTVEGLIRYHPFLYDKETYPKEVEQAPCDEDDDDAESGFQHPSGGRRPIFELFWNGRLIPYTTVMDFDWCAWGKESKLPVECYSRLSGVIFADHKFEVSTNKLTFMDLELKLKQKSSLFTRYVNGQRQRGIQKEFTRWIQRCHEKLDKEIKFLGYMESIRRTDVTTKEKQHPWATFSSIKWDGKVYKRGQLVKSHRTQPILYGTINRFLLYGNYNEDVFATAGQVEVVLQPKAFHDKSKIIPISKIDQTATVEAINKHIQSDLLKLPAKLKVEWPEDNAVPQNGVHPAGAPFGPLQVQILNGREELVQGSWKRLVVDLKIIRRGNPKDEEVFSCRATQTKWGYWFKKNDNLASLGEYTLIFNTVILDGDLTVFGGRELPSYKLNFTINAGSAESFTAFAASSAQVGAHFDITLRMSDGYNNQAVPPPNLRPVLACSDLDLSYEEAVASGMTVIIRNVKARGKLLNSKRSTPYKLNITLPGLSNDTQSLGIVLFPGKPHSLHVELEDNQVENGNAVIFNVEVHDEDGNITPNAKQNVICQIPGLPPLSADCSNTGTAQLTKPLNVTIIKGKPQKLQVQFEMPNQKDVAMVTKELLVLPSSSVCSMELYSKDDRNLVLRDGEKIDWPAGGLLENLHYRLHDESLFEVPLTPDIASKIKVNWKAAVNLDDLLMGKLPDLLIPIRVHEERFYQVSYQDQSVSVSFHIVPRPNEPSAIKVTLPQDWVRLGEKLPGNTKLEIIDEYGNETKTLNPACVNHMEVEAEGLDKSAVAFIWQESRGFVHVTGIQFNAGTPSAREMSFRYMKYSVQVVIKVMAGVPAQLKLLSEPEKPLQVFNESGIATPFVVQLCDKWGNPSPDDRAVVELLFLPLKVTKSVTSQSVDEEGKASFTVKSVSGPVGRHQMKFRGIVNTSHILGPSVNVIVLPDPNKPVRLSVEYDAQKPFLAGGKFPVFSVSVISEEGSPITTFNPADVSMFLWHGAPDSATELKCSKPMANEKTDCFHFRDKEIPEYAGKYTIVFSLRGAKVLSSDQITINVAANEPVKLGPDSQPPAPVVCYSKGIGSCTLVESLTLRIMDSFGNPAGQDLHGKVTVSIKNAGADADGGLPLFEGKANSVQFRLEEGKVHVSRLAVVVNPTGKDGSSCILIFTPEVSNVSTPLAPFQLPFHFYNDVDTQRKMAELTKKKNELTTIIKEYKDILNTNNELLQLLSTQHADACRKEIDQRQALNIKNVHITPPATVQVITGLVQEFTAELNQILIPRRTCGIHDPYRGQQDVLGMVGHLALVQDDDAARVISWTLSGDMDCVITKMLSAARRIYDATEGGQQVMPLDTVFVHPSRPLPHIRNGRVLFDPPGNPVLARDLLIYPQDKQSCDVVFRNLLGDVILIDDLDSGNRYRREVVQNGTRCPTILTRQGDRISANGKFGGRQNKAPPMSRLRSVFGAPHPERYYTLQEQIDMLNQYSSTLQKISKARDELSRHKKSPEMFANHQELEKKEKQLEEIEKQIESTVARTQKRHPDAGEPSGVAAKRAKRGSHM